MIYSLNNLIRKGNDDTDETYILELVPTLYDHSFPFLNTHDLFHILLGVNIKLIGL